MFFAKKHTSPATSNSTVAEHTIVHNPPATVRSFFETPANRAQPGFIRPARSKCRSWISLTGIGSPVRFFWQSSLPSPRPIFSICANDDPRHVLFSFPVGFFCSVRSQITGKRIPHRRTYAFPAISRLRDNSILSDQSSPPFFPSPMLSVYNIPSLPGSP